MARLVTHLVIDRADIEAYRRDLEAIFLRYGLPEDCAPHNRTALDAAMKRAGDTLGQCLQLEEKRSAAPG